MEALSTSLKSVQVSLERVLNYVRQVIKGERKGDVAVGRFVMEAVGSVNMGKTGVEGEELENLFNSHLQVSLLDEIKEERDLGWAWRWKRREGMDLFVERPSFLELQ